MENHYYVSIEMIKNKNLLYIIFFAIYLIVGIYLSITNGITSDESYERLNWQENLSGIKSLLANGNYDNFLEYQDKYHGIAFHYISQPIQFFTYKFISNLNGEYELTKIKIDPRNLQPDDLSITTLISSGESQTIEYKETFSFNTREKNPKTITFDLRC